MANMPRVLVVEDEQLLQRTLCATLTLLGFTPYHAATVDEALEVLRTQQIEAITLDIVLPAPAGSQKVRHVASRPFCAAGRSIKPFRF